MVANNAIFVNENENEPKKISNSFTRTRIKAVQKNEKWIQTKKRLQPNGIKTKKENSKPNENEVLKEVNLNVK